MNRCPAIKKIRSEKSKVAHQIHKEKNGNAKFNKGETVETQHTRNLKYPSRGDHICVYCGGHAEYQLNDGR